MSYDPPCGSGGQVKDYIYDNDGNISSNWINNSPSYIEYYANGWHFLSEYVNGAHTTSTEYFQHSDWLGAERMRSDINGNIFETCTSLPFGDDLNCIGTTDASPMHFTGKERDSESGLDNFGARYDSSALGRFMRPDDPLLYQDKNDPQTWNLYAYVRNNPLNRVDPNGHLTVIVPGTGWSSNDWNANMKLIQDAKELYNDSDVRILSWSGGMGSSNISAGADQLRDLVNGHPFAPGEQLNVITHSRGGEVALAATSGLHTPIDNLVALGLPGGWVTPDLSNIRNWSNIGILEDLVAPSWGNTSNGKFNEPGANNITFSLSSYGWHGAQAHSAYWNDPVARSLWQFWVRHQGCKSFVTTFGPKGSITSCGD